LLVGATIADKAQRCPSDNLPSALELLTLVAVWPIGIGAAISGEPPPVIGCKSS
jgi:hypothetical protein